MSIVLASPRGTPDRLSGGFHRVLARLRMFVELAPALPQTTSGSLHRKIAELVPSCYAFAMIKIHPRMSVVLVCGLLVGCRAKSTTEPDAAAPVAADNTDKDSNESSVSVDKNLSDMCNLPAPNFEFDSAQLSSSASATLEALAQCFISGPAKGKSMLIVGHADPRGDEEYNYGLGQRRADSVAGYLSNHGLSRSRIESSSRGELDAVGTEESSWRRDRRVEIGLAD